MYRLKKKRNLIFDGKYSRHIKTHNPLLASSVGAIVICEAILEEKLEESSSDYGGDNAHGLGSSPGRSNF